MGYDTFSEENLCRTFKEIENHCPGGSYKYNIDIVSQEITRHGERQVDKRVHDILVSTIKSMGLSNQKIIANRITWGT